MGDKRYFMTVGELLQPEEIPPHWGLVEVHGQRLKVIVKPAYNFHSQKDKAGEISLLASAVRRLGAVSVSGVSVKVYTYETKNTATIGVLK